MSRTRAATPAARKRASATGARRATTSSGKRPAAKRAASKRPAAKRAPAKRGAPKRAAAKRTPAKRVARRPAKAKAARATGWLSSWRARLIALAAVVLAAGAGYVFWLRDSSLVAITDVEVVGVTTSERPEVVSALTGAAKDMTTLHYDAERLEQIGSRFPTVAGVDVDPNFPHGMRLEVEQRPPRLIAAAGGEEVPVAADGTLLAGVSVPEDQPLPVLEVGELPAGEQLGGEPLEQTLVVGAAPDPLLGLVEKVDHTDDYGVVVTVRGGIEVRFGSGERADEKWAATAAVLADPKLDVASYLDVRVPERPAVGGAA
jgi:cell division protein FtsQ